MLGIRGGRRAGPLIALLSRGLVLLGFAIRLQFRRHGYAANFNRAATEKVNPPFEILGVTSSTTAPSLKLIFTTTLYSNFYHLDLRN